jgi:hypothetical protein
VDAPHRKGSAARLAGELFVTTHLQPVAFTPSAIDDNALRQEMPRQFRR